MPYQRKTKDVHIHPRLVEVLNRISNRSEVAKLLLKSKISKEDLVDDPIDYIAISKEDPSKISYAYAEKLEKVSEEEYWSFKGRVQAKPAAAIKKFLKNVSEKDLDIFTSLYKAATAQRNFILQVVSGTELKKWYSGRSYQQTGGTLYNSCMKHDHCQDFFEIYMQNPEVCQMLIMLDNSGYLMGRALLWNAVDMDKNTEIKVMDRIYCVDDNMNVPYFKEWADDNGYIYKKEQNWKNSLQFESNGVSFFKKISVKIKKLSFIRYPYVDTFKFWDEKNSTLSNFLPEDNGYIRTLIGNDGRVFGYDTLGLDDFTNMYDHRDRLITLTYEFNGKKRPRTSPENVVYSECMDINIFKDHATYSEDMNDWMFKPEFDQFNNKEKIQKRMDYFAKKREKKEKAKSEIDQLISNVETYTVNIGGFDYQINIDPAVYWTTAQTPTNEVQTEQTGQTGQTNEAIEQYRRILERYTTLRSESRRGAGIGRGGGAGRSTRRYTFDIGDTIPPDFSEFADVDVPSDPQENQSNEPPQDNSDTDNLLSNLFNDL